MVLVDTSVWISHLRGKHGRLVEPLTQGGVVCHPFIVGELACGNLKNRYEILTSLQNLPCSDVATDPEVLEFIEAHQLMGKGLSLVDMHLLASAVLSSLPLWTEDKRLNEAAESLSIAYQG